MNILEFEKYLLDKNFSDEKFLEDLEENFQEELKLCYPSKVRKLTNEETVYDYFDERITELFESLGRKNDHEKSDCCTCDFTEEEVLEKILEDNRKLVYRLALYLLRDGIHYDDLSQEGLLGLIKAANLYKDDEKFELYKGYFIIREMFKHIKAYSDYRDLSFKQYIELEKSKKIKISLKNLDEEKDKELKRLERENKLKYQSDIEKLESISKNIFKYSNLKYRLSFREIEILTLYFGLENEERKNFTDIENIMKISSDDVDKLLRESLFKLSVTDEKVEL